MAYDEMVVTEPQVRLLETPAALTLVDVRNAAEAAQGGIGAARHIPLLLLPVRQHELDNDKPMVFYCRRGNRSAMAGAFAAARGWHNVFNPRGGILGWLQRGESLSQAIH